MCCMRGEGVVKEAGKFPLTGTSLERIDENESVDDLRPSYSHESLRLMECQKFHTLFHRVYVNVWQCDELYPTPCCKVSGVVTEKWYKESP